VKIGSSEKKTFDHVPKHTFDLVKFNLPIPTLYLLRARTTFACVRLSSASEFISLPKILTGFQFKANFSEPPPEVNKAKGKKRGNDDLESDDVEASGSGSGKRSK
jgi:hypothetical protein